MPNLLQNNKSHYFMLNGRKYINSLAGDGGSSEPSRIIDMNNITTALQGSMKCYSSLDALNIVYSNGDQIGCTVHCTDSIDVTNANTLTFKLKTGPCYGHNNANVEEQTTERFQVLIGIVDSWTGINYLADSIASLLAYKRFKYTNTTYTELECSLDVSSITGNIYIGLDAHGWTLTFEEIRLS